MFWLYRRGNITISNKKNNNNNNNNNYYYYYYKYYHSLPTEKKKKKKKNIQNNKTIPPTHTHHKKKEGGGKAGWVDKGNGVNNDGRILSRSCHRQLRGNERKLMMQNTMEKRVKIDEGSTMR